MENRDIVDVRIKKKNLIINAYSGDNLLDILRKNSVIINSPCNGNGTCGKCKVMIYDDLNESEEILACKTKLKDNITIDVIEDKGDGRVLVSGYVPNVVIDEAKEGYAIALDIGTTTIAMSLVELNSGTIVTSSSALNPQKVYGLDVLSRISYEVDNGENGRKELQSILVKKINEMIKELIEGQRNINESDITEMVVSANCTMTHTLVGADITSMGRYPFSPIFTNALKIKALDIGISLVNCVIHTLPQVTAFIGSDIISGVYSVYNVDKKNFLFIDIGTNGEMVLYDRERFVSCSCAAGPALEGMNISCGMRAKDGAIERIHIDEDYNIHMKTIGDINPEGICGSGILSVVSQCLKKKIINSRGNIVKIENLEDINPLRKIIEYTDEGRRIVISKENSIYVTQSDIRQVQLAKAAILSGIKAMTQKQGTDYSDIEEVIIAGQFGKNLDEESLITSGILPHEFCNRIRYVGNTSMTGAYLAIVKKNALNEMEKLSEKMDYFELALSDSYERLFAKSSVFPVYE